MAFSYPDPAFDDTADPDPSAGPPARLL